MQRDNKFSRCLQVDNYCQSINHFGAQTLEKLHMLDGLHKARVSV